MLWSSRGQQEDTLEDDREKKFTQGCFRPSLGSVGDRARLGSNQTPVSFKMRKSRGLGMLQPLLSCRPAPSNWERNRPSASSFEPVNRKCTGEALAFPLSCMAAPLLQRQDSGKAVPKTISTPECLTPGHSQAHPKTLALRLMLRAIPCSKGTLDLIC